MHATVKGAQHAQAATTCATCFAARVRVQGPPNQTRMGPQGGMQGGGMMGRGMPGRGMPGRGRGGPEMMSGMNMPGPEFFSGMGMPMGGMPPMMPMGPNPMMMQMGDMDFNRMGGFDGGMGMGNMASLGMGMGPMGNPIMMGMGGMGDMGGGFPIGAMPPPRPPPRRMPIQEDAIRPGSDARPYSNDRMYDDERIDEYRDQARSGYSRYCKDPFQTSSSHSLASILPGSPVFYAVN